VPPAGVAIDASTITGTGDMNIDSGTLFVDASADAVGIGTTSPNSHLTTQTASTSTSAFDFGVQINNSHSSNDSIAALGFHNRADVNGTGVGGAIAFVGGGASGGSGNITFNIKDGTNISNVVDVADEKMRIDSAGRVTMPNQPAFLAYLTSNATQPGGTNLIVGTWGTLHNRGGYYNTSTKRFTAPIDGLYEFTFNLGNTGTGVTLSYVSAEIVVNGSRNVCCWGGGTFPAYFKVNTNLTIELSANDYVEVGTEVNTSFVMQGSASDPYTYFTGRLVG